AGLGREVGDDLVAVEVEVDPLGRAAAFGAAQELAVEGARGLQVVHGEGEVKGRERRRVGAGRGHDGAVGGVHGGMSRALVGSGDRSHAGSRQAVAAALRPSCFAICSRSTNFCTLPVMVMGSASTNTK